MYLGTKTTFLKWKCKAFNHSDYNDNIRFKLPNLPIQLISMRMETFTVIIGKLDCPLA